MQTANFVLSIMVLVAVLWSALGRPDVFRRRLRYLLGRRKAAHRVTWVSPETDGSLEQFRENVALADLSVFDLLSPSGTEPPWPVMTDVLSRTDGGFRLEGEGKDIRLYLAKGEGEWAEFRSWRADRRTCVRYLRKYHQRFIWLAGRKQQQHRNVW